MRLGRAGARRVHPITGRVEAMEKRLDATLGTVKTVGPPLAKFYNSLSDEQKARFNSLRSGVPADGVIARLRPSSARGPPPRNVYAARPDELKEKGCEHDRDPSYSH